MTDHFDWEQLRKLGEFIGANERATAPTEGEFVAKPQVVKAFQWSMGLGPEALPGWLLSAIDEGVVTVTAHDFHRITLEVLPQGQSAGGEVVAGDWLVLDRGNIYVYEDDMFSSDYDYRKWTDEALWQRFVRAAATSGIEVEPSMRDKAIGLLREVERQGGDLDAKMRVSWDAEGLVVSGE